MIRQRAGRFGSVGLLIALVCLVAACGMGRGRAVADRIGRSGSPLIDRVEFSPANVFGKPDEVKVYMVLGATEEQAITVWCEVVIPAGARPPSDPYVAIWHGEGNQQGVSAILFTSHLDGVDQVCPPDASAGASG